MNILIIHDNTDATASLQAGLASEGYTVAAARTVLEAVEPPDGSQVGAVLVGGCAPDADGLREIAAHAPVIVVTGHSDLPAAFAALRGRVAPARAT